MFMWSGGVESTATIKHRLETTDDEIYVHYIRHNSREGRLPHENRAIADLLPHLQAIRKFHYSESALDLIGGQGLAWDFQVMYPIALVAMRHFKCSQINRGLCLEDNWHRQQGMPPIRNPFGGGQHRHHTLRRALAHMLQGDETLDLIAPMIPEYEWPKAWHWQVLGELAPLTWSCRRPKPDGTECGKCHSCTDRAAAKRGTSDIAEVRAFIERSDVRPGLPELSPM